jgi:hypothetical protein
MAKILKPKILKITDVEFVKFLYKLQTGKDATDDITNEMIDLLKSIK